MKYIKVFDTRSDYEAALEDGLDLPNVSLILEEMESGGTGLETNAYIPEEPEPDVLLNGSKIKWNVTDGEDRTSVDDPNISFDVFNELLQKKRGGYDINATGSFHFDDGEGNVIDWDNAIVEINDDGYSLIPTIFDPNDEGNEITVAYLQPYSNTRAPAYNAVQIIVSECSYPTATWEINYTIEGDGF